MDSFFLDSFDDKSDLIPLLSAEDEKKIDSFEDVKVPVSLCMTRSMLVGNPIYLLFDSKG